MNPPFYLIFQPIADGKMKPPTLVHRMKIPVPTEAIRKLLEEEKMACSPVEVQYYEGRKSEQMVRIWEKVPNYDKFPALVLTKLREPCFCEGAKKDEQMVLCSHILCPIGWFHFRCVHYNNDTDWSDWCCSRCSIKGGNRSEFTDRSFNPSQSHIKESDMRVEMARAIKRAVDYRNGEIENEDDDDSGAVVRRTGRMLQPKAASVEEDSEEDHEEGQEEDSEEE
jgi:hypothetical protein